MFMFAHSRCQISVYVSFSLKHQSVLSFKGKPKIHMGRKKKKKCRYYISVCIFSLSLHKKNVRCFESMANMSLRVFQSNCNMLSLLDLIWDVNSSLINRNSTLYEEIRTLRSSYLPSKYV